MPKIKKHDPKVYCYTNVENVLDLFSLEGDRPAAYVHSYLMFKWCLHGIACLNYSGGGYSAEQCLAFAWEDAEIAFVGHQVMPLTTCINAMWFHVGKNKEQALEMVIDTALRSGENQTEDSVQRRYMKLIRNKPVRRPEQGQLPPVVPTYGPQASMEGLNRTSLSEWLKASEQSVQTSNAYRDYYIKRQN
ncbi:MAG: hypothetical protein EBU84_11180 [Actinobacteria bacterium]|nr:hypothetical protein [Actinomycetota bacterium]